MTIEKQIYLAKRNMQIKFEIFSNTPAGSAELALRDYLAAKIAYERIANA